MSKIMPYKGFKFYKKPIITTIPPWERKAGITDIKKHMAEVKRKKEFKKYMTTRPSFKNIFKNDVFFNTKFNQCKLLIQKTLNINDVQAKNYLLNVIKKYIEVGKRIEPPKKNITKLEFTKYLIETEIENIISEKNYNFREQYLFNLQMFLNVKTSEIVLEYVFEQLNLKSDIFNTFIKQMSFVNKNVQSKIYEEIEKCGKNLYNVKNKKFFISVHNSKILELVYTLDEPIKNFEILKKYRKNIKDDLKKINGKSRKEQLYLKQELNKYDANLRKGLSSFNEYISKWFKEFKSL